MNDDNQIISGSPDLTISNIGHNTPVSENIIDLVEVPISKLTPEIIARVNAFCKLIAVTENKEAAKQCLAEECALSLPTIHWYESKLRKLFSLEPRTSLSSLSSHPQLRLALEVLFTRKVRSDKASLNSAKNLSVLVPTTGEEISVEDYLKALYTRETIDATDCYLALKSMCLKKLITKASDHSIAILSDLPAETTVRQFLKRFIRSSLAARASRTRKHDFETQQQPYVTRDVSKLRPGEMWIGDHTELDFMVLNEEGKPDRRWITAFIDQRTGLLVGYNLNWQPTSQTIALAFREGVMGSQLKAFTGNKFERVNISTLPENVMMDNGKDYRSKYTQRVFGKVDFEDNARLSVQRITKLRYTLPYHGQSKAQMERWFGTIQKMLKCLPGYKGNKYQNKPDTLQSDLKSGTILNVEDFDAAVAVAINSYNNRSHRTLNNQTPLQCYLTNQTSQRSIDHHVLDFLMMKAQGRRIRRCQVTLMNTEYYSDQLAQYNDKLADVYYDPNDLGMVSIYVAGEFAAVASNKEMFGRDERGWQKILYDRKHGMKEIREEIKDFHSGITDRDARAMALEGRLLNMQPVSRELLKKQPAAISYLTGLESQSKEVAEELKREKEFAEVQEKRKRKPSPLSLTAVNDRIK
jgi:transposase InsO family protein